MVSRRIQKDENKKNNPKKRKGPAKPKETMMVAYRQDGQKLWEINEITAGTPAEVFYQFASTKGWNNVMVMRLIPMTVDAGSKDAYAGYKVTPPPKSKEDKTKKQPPRK